MVRQVLKGDSGVVAVEFALTAPILLLILLGAMAFALHFAILVAVIHAASEGARASVGGLTDAERQSAAVAQVSQVFSSYGALIPSANYTVNANPVTSGGSDTGNYQVTVSYNPGTLDIGNFYTFWALMYPSSAQPNPGSISYTATVADGGY